MKLKKSDITKIITEEITKSDVIDVLRHNKDAERIIRKIANDVLIDLFRVLYQHNNIFKNL